MTKKFYSSGGKTRPDYRTSTEPKNRTSTEVPNPTPSEAPEDRLGELTKLRPEWGKYLGTRAKDTPVPMYDWEHKELHEYELKVWFEALALLEAELREARIDELEQAWDWAVLNNRSNINGAWVLKRIRKLKSLRRGDTDRMKNE